MKYPILKDDIKHASLRMSYIYLMSGSYGNMFEEMNKLGIPVY